MHFLPRSTAARRCLVSSCSVLTLLPNESLAPLLPITMTKHYAPERDQTRGRTPEKAGNSGNTAWGERGVIQATWDVTDETTAHVSKSVYSCFMSLPYPPWLIVGATQAEPNCREARKVRKSRRQEDLHLRTHASGLVNVTRGACDHKAQAKGLRKVSLTRGLDKFVVVDALRLIFRLFSTGLSRFGKRQIAILVLVRWLVPEH